jgi:hypothetical protein
MALYSLMDFFSTDCKCSLSGDNTNKGGNGIKNQFETLFTLDLYKLKTKYHEKIKVFILRAGNQQFCIDIHSSNCARGCNNNYRNING